MGDISHQGLNLPRSFVRINRNNINTHFRVTFHNDLFELFRIYNFQSLGNGCCLDKTRVIHQNSFCTAKQNVTIRFPSYHSNSSYLVVHSSIHIEFYHIGRGRDPSEVRYNRRAHQRIKNL